MQTVKNIDNSPELSHQREYAEKLSAVVPGIKVTDILEQMIEKGVKKTTLDLIEKEPTNDGLKGVAVQEDASMAKDFKNITPGVAKAILSQNSKVLQYLPEKIKQDSNVAKQIIISEIKDGKNFLETESYLSQYFKNTKDYQHLLKFYKKTYEL